MTTAQRILDRLATLSTPQVEEIVDTLRGSTNREERVVFHLAIEALEIRDPQHPAVRAQIEEFNRQFDA